jgi:hypothetical protein
MSQHIDLKMRKVIIKYSVIIALFTFTVSKFFKTAIDQIVDVFLSPLLTVDINKDGKPDLKQLQRMDIKIGNVNFKIGQLLFAIIKLFLQILVVYLILSFILNHTNLIKI